MRNERHSLVATSQGIDTSESNSAGRLQMHVLAAVAEFEREVIKERITAGIAAAREHGTKSGNPFGRPRTLHRHTAAAAKLMRRGIAGRRIATELKIPAGPVFAVMRAVRDGAGVEPVFAGQNAKESPLVA